MLKNFSLLLDRPSFKQAIDDLQYTIQTGQNSFKHVNNLNIFEHLQQNPVDAKIFNEAMTAMTSSQVQTISSLYDFSQFNTVVDIGGGQGLFLSTILKNNSNLQGIVFDLPYAIEGTKQQQIQNTESSFSDANNSSIFSRCKFISGNFFESIPSGADGYIIKNVLLNWDDESASTILKNCLQAMKFSIKSYREDNRHRKIKPKLIIVDAIMSEYDDLSFGNLLDILMLVLTQNGRIRTKKEYIELLDSCGFEITNVLDPSSQSPLPSHCMNFLNIIEATPKCIGN